jgi:hypothetical protein
VNTDGTTFKPDIIIYATGSDVARQGVGLNVGLKGQDGVELKEYWESIGGPQSYQGVAIPGVGHWSFPRLTGSSQTTLQCSVLTPSLAHGASPLVIKQQSSRDWSRR